MCHTYRHVYSELCWILNRQTFRNRTDHLPILELWLPVMDCLLRQKFGIYILTYLNSYADVLSFSSGLCHIVSRWSTSAKSKLYACVFLKFPCAWTRTWITPLHNSLPQCVFSRLSLFNWSPVWPNIFISTLFTNARSVCFVWMWGPNFIPIQGVSESYNLYILIIMFLDRRLDDRMFWTEWWKASSECTLFLIY